MPFRGGGMRIHGPAKNRPGKFRCVTCGLIRMARGQPQHCGKPMEALR
jgi:hypothetical protein